MNWKDTSHVPAPEPKKFWDFAPGEKFVLVSGGARISFWSVSLMLLELESRRARFLMTVDGRELKDWLQLNVPVVALKTPDDEPAVTLTLREVRDGKAFLQVTHNPRVTTAVPRG